MACGVVEPRFKKRATFNGQLADLLRLQLLFLAISSYTVANMSHSTASFQSETMIMRKNSEVYNDASRPARCSV